MKAPLLPLSNNKDAAARHQQSLQTTVDRFCCCRTRRNSIVTKVCCRPIVVAVVAALLTVAVFVSAWNRKPTYSQTSKFEVSILNIRHGGGEGLSAASLRNELKDGNYYRPDRFKKNCSVIEAGRDNYRQVMLNGSIDGFSTLSPLRRTTADTVTAGMQLPNVGASNEFIRIIHRTWKSETVPDKWLAGVTTCRQANSDWIYCHWTDDELLSFITAEYPDFLSTYNAYPYDIQRVDAARYLLLYHYGGIYLDLDIKCKLSFDDILSDVASAERSISSSSARSDVVLAQGEPFGLVGEFLAVRRRRDPFMRHVIVGLDSAAERWYPLPYVEVMFSTGPVYLYHRLLDFNRVSTEVPNVNSTSHVSIVPTRKYVGTYFGHMHGGTWHEWDGHLIWAIFRFRRPLICLGVGCVVVLLLLLVMRLRRRDR